MSTHDRHLPPGPHRPAHMGAVMLFLLACPPYAVMLRALIEVERGDFTLGGGEFSLAATLLQLAVGVPGGLLWIALAFLVFGRTARAATPGWAKPLVPVLFLLCLGADIAAIVVMFRFPGGSSILVPELLPLLVALYAMWLRSPALHSGPRPNLVGAMLLGAIAVPVAATLPLAYLDEAEAPRNAALRAQQMQTLIARQNATLDKAIAADQASFSSLTPDSPLGDYLGHGGTDREQTIARMRLVKSRQSDAVGLLNDGRLVELDDLWRLDLQVTPALCEAYDRALRRGAEGGTSDMPRTVAEAMEKQVPNMKWFVAGRCDLASGLAAVEAKVRRVAAAIGPDDPDQKHWQDFLTTLAALKQGH